MDQVPLPAPVTARPPPPRSGSGRLRRSATSSREGSLLPDLNLNNKRKLSVEIHSEQLEKRQKVEPEIPVLSEKSKGKQPALEFEPTPEPSPSKRHTTPPSIEPLSAYTCPICFCPPTNATLTPCGHVCCGECLFAAVNTAAQRTRFTMEANGGAKCPVCRAHIPGWDGRGGGVIGLRPRAVYAL